MSELDYSNREIDMLMKEIHEKLDLILDQTTRTNGRVTKLEAWKATSIGWTGGVGACIAVIIALSVYIFSNQIGTLSAQEKEIQTTLSNHINK